MNFRKTIFILVVFLLLAGIHLYFYTQNITRKYQLSDLKVKLGEQLSQKRDLGAKAARFENLAVIEQIALKQLGMAYPEKVNYVTNQTPEATPAPK